ncbi:hypothetical protein HCC30_18680 [Streptomyces sp. HNM0574]|nr:hypothetical protein [Streptomyces sp. HNM0574]
MATVALACVAVTGTTGWAAGSAQTAVTGPPPGTAAWRAEGSPGQRLPDPATARPERVAAYFARLDGTERHALAHRHPLVVGNLDGAPVRLRYEANRSALRNALRRARATAEDLSRGTEERHKARSAVRRYASLLAPGRRILAFDPRGRGQVAEAYGELSTARHTAVIVPGSDIDLGTYDRRGPNRYGTPAGMAQSLHRATEHRAGARTAVVAWTGYTTPVGLGPDAATARLAEAGAPRLARFLRGLSAADVAAPTVLCHSYGSVVCGAAAHTVTAEDAAGLVLFGSPGTGARSAAALGTPVPVWAARAEDDWISHVPGVRLLGLGHGTAPTDPGFGARVLSADGARGHTGYLRPGTASLANFASVTLGSYEAVHCAARGCTDGL